ncbi:fluoride efflux transporter CrcB [Methylobacter sp. S3L5C]|uniref:fluoride efflux transporter CrcB n=1 Tax=Methylobacter sp. S3L5C TaxID=2839024 RepID=UPI001FAD7D5B|nr:fluoride efflux transporter CrcB [Methylobacter sp. S3L5C]UOA07671.1 fluoride efflux transporter CrcB [Methylobacter sp. S3L5C]
MNQIIAVALGGASGAVMRFLISSGLYQWLGRGFPYGTLVVNVLGSFLIGLLTEALILQRIPMTLEYRAAILVGFIGAFTTFSTFSLETIYLLEQGSLNKAALNVIVSLVGCLLAVWIGLLCGRTLFLYSGGMFHWSGGVIPFALLIVNAIGAFLIGIVATILLQKVALSMEYRAAMMVIMIGAYLTLSGLYLVLFLIEHGYSFETHTNLMLGTFVGNGLGCLLVIWLGLLVGKQI